MLGQAKEYRAFQSPCHYMQGPGLIKRLPEYCSLYGNAAVLLIDPFFYDDFSVRVPKLFEEAGMKAYAIKFPGFAGKEELEQIVSEVEALPEIPDTFIGMGGGQAVDINKAVAARFRKNWISFPTALSCDAPTFMHTIVNHRGAQNELVFHYKNPDYVVVDTEITINSPASLFAAGIGDAMATYFEAEASHAHNNTCNSGHLENASHPDDYKPTLLGLAAARLCYEILARDGVNAMRAAKAHVRTAAYENVAEATTLLSGLGCENTGVSIAHGLSAGFGTVGLHVPHGIGVGYCLLIQMIMENNEHFEELFKFNKAIGLPIRSTDIGMPADKAERDAMIAQLIDNVYGKRWNVTNEPFFFEPGTLADAIKYLDVYADENA